MKNNIAKNLITESELFNLKASSAENAELKIHSLIMFRKHLDYDAKIKRKYFVRLYDNQPQAVSIELESHAIALEAKRLLVFKHMIEDGGTESDKSKYLSFYFEEED